MKRLARTDLAIHSRQLLHQSIWCGVVFGLATLLTVLNALPPVKVEYLVSGKLIASPLRAQALRQNLFRPSESELSSARLRDLTLLDDASPELKQYWPSRQQVVFLGLSSVWQSRCNIEEFQHWIDSIAQDPDVQRTASANQTSQELRVTRWEYEAARHYQAHDEFLQEPPASESAIEPKNEKGVFTLASTGSMNSVRQQLPNDPKSAEFKRDLANNVQALQKRVETLNQQQLAEQQQIAGKIELTDGPKIQPHCHPIPIWMALSVVVLGLAAGSCAGWLQLRLQSGGVYDPLDVATQLSRTGLPVVAQVELSSDQLDATDWLAIAGQKASTAGRTGGRNLIVLSESMLALWCAIIVGRLCFDPLWRGLLVDSPLGALGRLLSGMP